jgi:single-strand DNA-binding protein
MSAPITITGNLVADPELKFTQNAKALATFTVVSSKSSKKPDGTWENTDTTFWDIKVWGKTAENVADSLRKGVSVIVSGTAVQESWDDKNTGQKRSKITVTAWNVGADLKRHTYSVPVIERSDASYNPPSAVSEFDPWSAPLAQDAPPF